MKSPQILLIQPPVEDFYTTDCRTQPAGLVYLAAALREKIPEVQIRIIDALSGGNKKSMPWPQEFHYLKKYYGLGESSPFRLFEQYYRFGMSPGELSKEFQGLTPMVIGISSLFTPYYRQSLETAALCREMFPDAHIVFGGNHATSLPESLLFSDKYFKAGDKDYVIPGEGEIIFCELVESILTGRPIPREVITRRSLSEGKKSNMKLPDINFLPEPAFDLLERNLYTMDKQPLRFCITSRGCPYRCHFCGIHTVFGKSYRRRNNESIIREIKNNIGEEITQIDFEDDHFTARKKETIRLLDEIIKIGRPLKLSLMNGVVYWTLDSEVLRKMKQAGFSTLNLSLVSREESIERSADRHLDLQKFREVVFDARQEGFFIIAYFILGRPGQTEIEISDTLGFLADLPVLAGASPYYLSPGSPDYDKFQKGHGLSFASIGKDQLFSARLTAMDIETQEFNRDTVYTFFRLSRLVNYVKKGMDLGYLPDHEHFLEVRKIIREKSFKSVKSKKAIPESPNSINLFFKNGLQVSSPRTNARVHFLPDGSVGEHQYNDQEIYEQQ